jgi:hypothetical protein
LSPPGWLIVLSFLGPWFSSFEWIFGIGLLGSPCKNEPAVERGSSALAATAGADPKGVSHTLDGIAKANILVGDETWKANPVRWMTNLRAIGFVFLHRILSLVFVVNRN